MSNNNTISAATSNISPSSGESIHKLISCENIKDLLTSHTELCNAVYSSLAGGCSFEEVSFIICRLIDQSEEIETLITAKISLES